MQQSRYASSLGRGEDNLGSRHCENPSFTTIEAAAAAAIAV
jgi:hypothetical protein